MGIFYTLIMIYNINQTLFQNCVSFCFHDLSKITEIDFFLLNDFFRNCWLVFYITYLYNFVCYIIFKKYTQHSSLYNQCTVLAEK